MRKATFLIVFVCLVALQMSFANALESPLAYLRTSGGAVSMPGQGACRSSLESISQAYGLRVTSIPGSGRIELSGSGMRLTIAPGMPYVVINNSIARLPSAPHFRAGRLWLPDQIDEILRANRSASAPVSGVIILDPGHGGKDSGAVANGLAEKDLVLDVALRAAEMLRTSGAEVILTRYSDRFLTLNQRAEIANQTPGAIFVSIHANAVSRSSSNWRSARGIETFYLANRVSEKSRVNKAARLYDISDSDSGRMSSWRKKRFIADVSSDARQESARLAQCVQGRIVEHTGDNDRKVRQGNLHVLRENYFGPAILTEIGFLTNPQSAAQLKSERYREEIAKAICRGISDYANR